MRLRPTALLLLLPLGGHAQQAVLTGGGEAGGNGGSVSFSIGQVAYRRYDASAASVQQGVQQPLPPLSTGMADRAAPEMTLLPNPAGDRATILLHRPPTSGMKACLWSADGRLVAQYPLLSARTVIELGTFPKGAYLVELREGRDRIASSTLLTQ